MSFLQKMATQAQRAMQYTQENLGNAEKTELDAHFENLIQRGETTREWTEKILNGTEAVLQPNPKVRMEQYVFDKMDKRNRDIITNEEDLGQHMIDAGNEFGPGTAYGNSLVKTGQTFMRIGIAHKNYSNAAANKFLQPLHNFLQGDVKTVQKEKRELELKRLDLDAAKNKLKKIKANSKENDPDVAKAEKDLHAAQVEFDRQAEVTKILLEGIASSHAHHLRCLTEYIDSMKEYFDQCQQYTNDLQKQLQSIAGGGSTVPGHGLNHFSIAESPTHEAPPSSRCRINYAVPHQISRARVLYDYDAASNEELSLLADEVIRVFEVSDLDRSSWVIGLRDGNLQGKVPVAYLQML